MKVIRPSAHILEHLDQLSMESRIEYCGRLCYKSEDRITQESALPFVEKVITQGHNSVLEMAVVTIEVPLSFIGMTDFFTSQPKYFQVSGGKKEIIITGSIRSWREAFAKPYSCAVVNDCCALINDRHPYFFADILKNIEGKRFLIEHRSRKRKVCKISLQELEEWNPGLFAQHRHVAVKFVVNRAVSHEMVRHRPCGFLQESQRYCNYGSGKFGNEVAFIAPSAFFDCKITGKLGSCRCDNQAGEFCVDCLLNIRGVSSGEQKVSEEFAAWLNWMNFSEAEYLWMVKNGHSPQAARMVLPNSCKTELIVLANLEQWQHIFKLRCSKAADPSMREVMIPLREDFAKRWPEVFVNNHK